MSDKTGIEWTDATWNPIRGCSRVSEGCRHCYAEGQAARIIKMDRGRGVPEGEGAYNGLLAERGQWNGKIKVVEDAMDQPLRWRKPRLIFVNSMSDLFHENVPDEVIDRVFMVMREASHHVFQVLTKRPQRMREYLNRFKPSPAGDGYVTRDGAISGSREGTAIFTPSNWPLQNVWLGVSVENQAAADTRIPLLLDTPAAVRWLSCEPLLGPVDLTDLQIKEGGGVHHFSCLESDVDPEDDPWGNACIDWVVAGGESGKDARPMHPQWALGLRDQCADAGVPFLFKQWGEWVPRSACYHTFTDGSSCSDHDPEAKRWMCTRLTEKGNNGRDLAHAGEGCDAYMQRVGKKMAGRLLDGKLHDEYPIRDQAA